MNQIKSYAIRLPEKAIKEMEAVAEQSNIEPAPGAEVGATTPGTDGHQTQRAGADGY